MFYIQTFLTKSAVSLGNCILSVLTLTALYILRYFITFSGSFAPHPPGATQPIVGVYFTALYRAFASSRTRLLDHTQRRATFGRTPLNE